MVAETAATRDQSRASESSTANRRDRQHGLWRQWRRAVGVILILLTLGVAIDVVAVHMLVNRLVDTTERTERVLTTNNSLQQDLDTYSDQAHLLIEEIPGTPWSVDQDAARTVRRSITSGFEQLIDSDVSEASVLAEEAYEQWRVLDIATVVVVSESPEDKNSRHEEIEAEIGAISALLDDAATAEREAASVEMDSAREIENLATGAIIVMGILVLVFITGYARRMSREVLRPIEALQVSAGKLAAGDIDHRIELQRDNELGDLVAAFNAMADAIAGNQRTLSHQALHDALTGLANRTRFGEQLEASLRRADGDGRAVAILFVDLDDFKDVNDTLGHAAGDALLRIVAERIISGVRPDDIVARLGGDEFAVLLDDVGSEDIAAMIAQRVVTVLGEPISVAETTVHVGASVGLAMRTPAVDADQLMRNADVAMYTAKRAGKHRVERFDATQHQAVVHHQALRMQVAHAARSGQLVLEYQPIVDLVSGRLQAVEALVRWQHPTEGLLPPSAFLALAEETGAIVDIGHWVLDTATRQVAAWQQQHRRPDLDLAVNMSARQLAHPGFAERLLGVLRRHRFDPGRLVVEIPEAAFSDLSSNETLAEIRRRGVRVALDDFGTGQSVLSQLNQLQVDILKVDRSFVAPKPSLDPSGMLDTLVALGQRLGLDVVPEGIEDSEQLAYLRQLGCRIGQGFLLARPGSSATIDDLLKKSDRSQPAGAARLGDDALARQTTSETPIS